VLLLKNYKGKVILMSATLQPEIFIDYFFCVSKSIKEAEIPIIRCDVSMHVVQQLFLDDLEKMLNFNVIYIYSINTN
jgi:HrpA-like RNA helicase